MTTTPTTVASVRADLLAEQDALDAIMAVLPDDRWTAPTASDRWTVADQIAHLAYFDDSASWAIADEERFRRSLADLAPLISGDLSDAESDDITLGEYRSMSPAELLQAWRTNRERLADAAAGLAEDARVIWYGPSMGAKSFLTARLMECWAHGQHIVDAVGVERVATDRIQHIAQLGFITRRWTYLNRGMDDPTTPVRVELEAPSGATWTFGPHDAAQSVVGTAVDFCLVVTQCRHVDDTALVLTGDDAQQWMTMAQAFAGAATSVPALPPSEAP